MISMKLELSQYKLIYHMFEMTFEGIINDRLKSSNDRREWFLEIRDADQPLKFVSFIAIKLYYFILSYRLYDIVYKKWIFYQT